MPLKIAGGLGIFGVEESANMATGTAAMSRTTDEGMSTSSLDIVDDGIRLEKAVNTSCPFLC